MSGLLMLSSRAWATSQLHLTSAALNQQVEHRACAIARLITLACPSIHRGAKDLIGVACNMASACSFSLES